MKRRYSKRRTLAEVLKSGRKLAAVREFSKGHFLRLCNEFGMRKSTAYLLIRAAQYVDTKLLPDHAHLLDRLSPTLLYRLAQANLPVQTLEEALSRDGKITALRIHAWAKEATRQQPPIDKDRVAELMGKLRSRR